jgi:1-acyl-sn-glycerol-3-phosphate acyltransferase
VECTILTVLEHSSTLLSLPLPHRNPLAPMTTPTLLKPFNLRRLWIIFRGISIVTPWIFHLFVTDLALSALLPLSFVFPTASYNLSSYLASLVWRGIQYIFTEKNQARITKSGTPLPHHESAILVANHVSWTDFYLIQQLAIDCGMLGRCRWFAKQQLKWVPFLGWGLWAMGMPLVSREWTKDKKEMERVFWGPKALGWPICASASSFHVHCTVKFVSYGH